MLSLSSLFSSTCIMLYRAKVKGAEQLVKKLQSPRIYSIRPPTYSEQLGFVCEESDNSGRCATGRCIAEHGVCRHERQGHCQIGRASCRERAEISVGAVPPK